MKKETRSATKIWFLWFLLFCSCFFYLFLILFCFLFFCWFFLLQVYETKSPKKIRNGKNTQGQLLSFREISCVLPNNPLVLHGNPSKSSGIPARAFYIKVSNDGNKFSVEEGLIIIYDSKCMECTKNGTRTCNLKVGAFVQVKLCNSFKSNLLMVRNYFFAPQVCLFKFSFWLYCKKLYLSNYYVSFSNKKKGW